MKEENNPNWDEWFYYDESSPSCLRWKVDRFSGRHGKIKGVSSGDIAGTLNASGYYSVTLGRKKYRVHRIVYELFSEGSTESYIDHINGDRSDNRVGNLRSVSKSENNRNSRKPVTNTSGVVGVCLGTNCGRTYWIAAWQDLLGKRCYKLFPINKLGNDEAFRLACEYRAKMIEELNALGAGYTERHGK